MSNYVIEKNVPIPSAKREGFYTYTKAPFGEIEVGDCIKLKLSELIPNNSHPDTKERARIFSCMHSYLKRKYPNKEFVYRVDKPINTYRYKTDKEAEQQKQFNLNRCVRVWRVK